MENSVADEKALKDAQYVKTPKEMTALFEERAALFNAVATLSLAVGSLGKGQVLRFYIGDNEYRDFSRKDMRSVIARFAKSEKDLKHYFRVSKKKTKSKLEPESLKGTYTPLYAGEVLKAFFTTKPENFGPLDPVEWKKKGSPKLAASETLMESLKFVQNGYMLRNTLTMLFFLYVRAMELQEPENAQFSHFDQVMIDVFSKKAAEFYVIGDGAKADKIPMDKAVKDGLIKAPLSTEQVIKLRRPNFNDEQTPIIKTDKPEKQIYRKAYANSYFQLLASCNYYSSEDLKKNPTDTNVQLFEILKNKQYTDQMVIEHQIVRDTAARWNEYLEPLRKKNRDAKKKERDAEKKAQKRAEAAKQ